MIIGYHGSPVEDAAALQRVVTRTSIGAKATIKVLRDGHEKELSATITSCRKRSKRPNPTARRRNIPSPGWPSRTLIVTPPRSWG